MNNGIIWNAFPSVFKDNVTVVNKITNNYVKDSGDYDSGVMSTTADKLWIMSPSEMGMPVSIPVSINSFTQAGADVHVYSIDGGYDGTVKSTSDGNLEKEWHPEEDYLYSNDTYQWWMLPAGDRKMSNGDQAYHDTDSYSYCAVSNGHNPSSNAGCSGYFWLRSPYYNGNFAYFDGPDGYLDYNDSGMYYGVIPAFSF